MTAHTQGTLILKAIEFASRKHKGQVRKVSGGKYITHPLLVSYLVAQYKTSKNLETLICAALLHDTVEDTKTTYTEILKGFGIEVAQLVFELTSDPAELKRVGKVEHRDPQDCEKGKLESQRIREETKIIQEKARTKQEARRSLANLCAKPENLGPDRKDSPPGEKI